MPIVVQKFGGTSVDGPDRIRAVAADVVATHRAGNDVIVVVSAMGQTTDEMERLAYSITPDPPQREMDMLVTAGERITMSLLAMAIHALGEKAISFTGSQSGIITDTRHGNARITEVKPFRIREALEVGRIAIVAGYQGVSTEKEVTTLGRGGSDLTAVALAAAFDAERCELRKDVDGVFTADPRHCPAARCLVDVPAEAMLALAECGSQVLYHEAVRFAMEGHVRLLIRSSFSDAPGTRITLEPAAGDLLYGLTKSASGVTLVGGRMAIARLHASLPAGTEAPHTDPNGLALTWPATGEGATDLLRTLHAHYFEARLRADAPAPSPA